MKSMIEPSTVVLERNGCFGYSKLVSISTEIRLTKWKLLHLLDLVIILLTNLLSVVENEDKVALHL